MKGKCVEMKQKRIIMGRCSGRYPRNTIEKV